MGTKIQCKTVLPGFYSVKDLNGSMSNGMCLLSHDERTLKIGQHYDSFSPRFSMDGYFEYEKEKVRQTILKHESTFRHQLQELHRLYIRQRELMNDLKMRELHKNPVRPDFLKSTNCLADLNEPILIEDTPILASDANPSGTIYLVDDGIQKTKKFHENCLVERNGGIHGGNRSERLAFDINADVQSDDLPTAFPSSQPSPSKACEPLPAFPNHPKKKTIFGVVISEDNREQIFTASSENINSRKQSLDFNGGKIDMNGNISSKGSLPWFLAKSQHNLQQTSRGEKPENCYHMNLDLLQNCSHQFFKKSEIDESLSRVLNQKQDICEPSKADVSDDANVKKIFGVPIFNSSGNLKAADSISRASFLDVEGDNSNRNQIDLNLSLDEEEDPPAPCLPRVVVKIANTEIDLEAPAVLEPEENESLEAEFNGTELTVEESLQPREEVTRQAAEAIVSISSSCANNMLDEAESSDCLKWLADVIDSHGGNIMDTSSGKGEPDEESIPDGMDYFESMTLELRDMKEEGKCYEPSILEINFDEEEESRGATPKRPRRGQARRGRQRRDFQRDVLPSMVSLSRHEVSEDILTFEELMKTTGSSWQSRMSMRKAAKNGRGKRRFGSSIPSLTKTATSQPQPPPIEVEKTSLTGWGKRTRRLPRQRCPNTNLSPLKQC